jgi:hypothetical protein
MVIVIDRTICPTCEHARTGIACYIEFRYDTQRLRSVLGYRTLTVVHDEYLNRQHAA